MLDVVGAVYEELSRVQYLKTENADIQWTLLQIGEPLRISRAITYLKDNQEHLLPV